MTCEGRMGQGNAYHFVYIDSCMLSFIASALLAKIKALNAPMQYGSSTSND